MTILRGVPDSMVHLKPRWLFAILLLISLTLACQAASLAFRPARTETLNSAANELPQATSTAMLLPSPTPSSTPTASPTPLPPSPTPSPTPTPTVVVTPSALQLSVFETLWQTVNDNYLYPDFNGLDWNAMHGEYAARVKAGMTDTDFYLAMAEMISRLGDDHSVFLSPERVRQEDSEFAGENDFVGIGVLTNLVPERERITILAIFPGSPADKAGLVPHDSILAVDGKPIMDETGFHREYIRGPEGSTVELTVQSPGEAQREVTVTRQRVTGAVPVPYEVLTTSQGKRIGYVFLMTFADDTVDDQLGEALRAMTASAPLDGLILDNRQNGGGADVVARGALSYFTKGSVGYFVNRQQERRALRVIGKDIGGSSKLPLVVLVGSNTASFGEIYSGVLRDMGRATIIGELTGGNVELLRGYDFEDGSRAWIANEKFHPRNHPNQDWEASGIIPDITVPSNWDEVTLQTDPAVQAALDLLDTKPQP
jgi:carboxyl-terminal processing protease